MKKIIAIFLTFALLAAICCTFAGCGKDELGLEQAQKDPLKYLQKALERTKEATASPYSTQLQALNEALPEKGSITVNYEDSASSTAVNADIAYNSKKSIACASLSLTINGQDIAMELWLDDDELCLKVPQYLGDTAYGISCDNLREDLAASEIWAVMGTSYEAVKSQLEPILDKLEKSVQNPTDPVRQLEELADKINIILNEIEYTVEETDNNEVKITCQMNKEQLMKLADTVIEHLFADYTNSSIIEDIDVSQAIDQIRDVLESTTGDVTLIATISNETGLITSLHFNYVLSPSDNVFVKQDTRLTIRADMEDLKDITIDAYIEGYTVMKQSISLRIQSSDTAGKLDRKFTLSHNDEIVGDIAFTYDGTDFSILVSEEDDTSSITGKLTLTEKKLELSDIQFTDNGVKTSLPLRITLDTAAKVEAMPSYKNILKLTAEEWEALIESVGNALPMDLAA